MGYRYQNNIDQAKEKAFWRNRPIWLRRFCAAAKILFFVLIVLLGMAATVVPLWQFAYSLITR